MSIEKLTDKCVIAQTISKRVINQARYTCNNEMADLKRVLATEYWSVGPDVCCVDSSNGDIIDSDLDCAEIIISPSTGTRVNKRKACEEQCTSVQQPVEDITHVVSLSDLSDIKRVATRFHLFQDLTDECDILVPLSNGSVMNVPYKDIRYVESFLFRMMYKETNLQRQFKRSRVEPFCASVFKEIPRLSAAERAIILCLISYNRCRGTTLVAYLNIQLQQLTAFTFELIRRGCTMSAKLEWYIGEYMDNIERKNIKGVVEALVSNNQDKLSVSICQNWRQQFSTMKVVAHKLLDLCVDVDATDKRVSEDELSKFHKKIAYEISSLDSVLEPNYERISHETFCKLVHLTQLTEAAFTMTTPTLIMEIQRRVDKLSLIIMEHNMRAQSNSLLFNREFYQLAGENTILAWELLNVRLYYEKIPGVSSGVILQKSDTLVDDQEV